MLAWFRKISSTKWVVIFCVVFIYVGTTMCGNSDTSKGTAIVHPNGKAFAGSETCRNCHQNIVDAHRKTAHFLTSGIADTSTVKGSFVPGANSFVLSDRLSFTMESS